MRQRDGENVCRLVRACPASAGKKGGKEGGLNESCSNDLHVVEYCKVFPPLGVICLQFRKIPPRARCYAKDSLNSKSGNYSTIPLTKSVLCISVFISPPSGNLVIRLGSSIGNAQLKQYSWKQAVQAAGNTAPVFFMMAQPRQVGYLGLRFWVATSMPLAIMPAIGVYISILGGTQG